MQGNRPERKIQRSNIKSAAEMKSSTLRPRIDIVIMVAVKAQWRVGVPQWRGIICEMSCRYLRAARLRSFPIFQEAYQKQ